MSLAMSSRDSMPPIFELLMLELKVEEEEEEKLEVELELMETFLVDVMDEEEVAEADEDCWKEDDCWTEELLWVTAPLGLGASPSLFGALIVRTPSLERAVETRSMLATCGRVNSL